METRNTLHFLEAAMIGTMSGAERVVDLQWQPHPAFEGVAMKTLLASEKTEGDFSCHLVKVNPGCCLESHIHERQQELHHVAAGSAKAEVGERVMEYRPGDLNVIAKGMTHRVEAGPEGVLLMALFTPALV